MEDKKLEVAIYKMKDSLDYILFTIRELIFKLY